MRGWMMGLGALAGVFGAAGVGLAAVGAHMSGEPAVTTAAYFLLFHAGAMVGLCAVARASDSNAVLAATSIIALGVVLFSGDLALRALAKIVLIHMAAPTGGMLMIAGWLVAAVALPLALRRSAVG